MKETSLQRDKRLCREHGGLIYDATAPMLDAAVKEAHEHAERRVAFVRTELEKAGWDLNVAAPWPTTSVSRAAYLAARNRRHLFQSLTRTPGNITSWRGQPEIREMHPPSIESFIAAAEHDAAQQYHAFIYKLTKKVGGLEGITNVTLRAPIGVWHHSVLTVFRGEYREAWRTRTIVNHSVLGKSFLQWPTTKTK